MNVSNAEIQQTGFYKTLQHDPVWVTSDWMLLTKLSSISWTSINESKSINQSILEIDFDRTLKNEFGRLTFWRLGISISYRPLILLTTF